MKVPEFNKHLKKAGWHIGRNVVEIMIKIKTIARKTLNDKKHQASAQKFRQWIIISSFWHIVIMVGKESGYIMRRGLLCFLNVAYK